MMKLPKQEILSILITFTVGFFAGGYLYLNHFTKMISPDDVTDIQEIERLTIVSEAYGGCRDACPAFQVKFDGTYRYRYTPQLGGETLFKEGTLPLDIQRGLKKALNEKDLSKQSKEINAVGCESYADGIDIRYDVTLSSETYQLDSCGTSVDFSSDTWIALAKIWNYFQTIQ